MDGLHTVSYTHLKDMIPFLKQAACIVHPSYYPEGMSNVLLEGAASARPIIATDRAGCRETVEDGVTGFLIPIKDEQALVEALEKFMQMTPQQRKAMGLAAVSYTHLDVYKRQAYSSVSMSVLENGFENAWREICRRMKAYRQPAECADCKLAKACVTCPGEKTFGELNGSLNQAVCEKLRLRMEQNSNETEKLKRKCP